MSYQWTSAATPQGRERLKELIGNKACVHCFHGSSGHFLAGISYCWDNSPEQKSHAVSIKWTKNFLYIDGLIDWAAENRIEFLDPSPSQPKDENGLLQTILALPDDTSADYIKSMIHDHTAR